MNTLQRTHSNKEELQKRLTSSDVLRNLEEGIFSVLSEGSTASEYDSRAMFYDWVVGNPFYNRFIWGNWPSAYTEFAKQADHSSTGWLLDIGGGSMKFTADLYAATERQVVVFDRSYGMLQRAKSRLKKLNNGQMPDNILLVQGDLFTSVFKEKSFETITFMGMLHLFENFNKPLDLISPLLTPEGKMYMTSLVKENKLAEKYLNMLHKSGDVATPRSTTEVLSELKQASSKQLEVTSHGNIAFAIAS